MSCSSFGARGKRKHLPGLTKRRILITRGRPLLGTVARSILLLVVFVSSFATSMGIP